MLACVFVGVYTHTYACMHIWTSIMCTGGRGGADWRCTRCACMHQCTHIICALISIHMYMSIHVCALCINAYTLNLHTCKHVYMSIHMYIPTYIPRCACVYESVSTCTHHAVYTYIYAHSCVYLVMMMKSPWCGSEGIGFREVHLCLLQTGLGRTYRRHVLYVGAVTIFLISLG